MSYTDRYAKNFRDEFKNLCTSNPKLNSIIKKAITVIINNPHHKAEYIKECECWRKHVAAEKYRIFYDIKPEVKEIRFYSIRIKDKQTYKRKIIFNNNFLSDIE